MAISSTRGSRTPDPGSRLSSLLLELLDPDVAELNAGAVTEEANVTLGVGDATRALRLAEIAVGLQHLLVLDVVQAGIHDRRAIELDGDLPSLRRDLLRVPFADRLLEPALRSDHAVDRPVVLIRLQAGVLGTAVVQHLDLDAGVGGVAFERRADADAVVGVLGQPDVEAKNEIRVLLVGVQISTVVLRGIDDAVLDLISLARLVLAGSTPPIDPASEILAVEQRSESRFQLLHGRRDGWKQCQTRNG